MTHPTQSIRGATSRVKTPIEVFRYAKYRANIEQVDIAIVDSPAGGMMTLRLCDIRGDKVYQVVHPDRTQVDPS